MTGESRTGALWRAALGLLALDAAFAFLVVLAAHPWPKGAPRPIVVAIADPAPAVASPAASRYAVAVPIGRYVPPRADVAALIDGADAPGIARVDRLTRAAPPPRDAAARPIASDARADRLIAAAPPGALGDAPRAADALPDRLSPTRAGAPVADAAAAAGPPPAGDRLIAGAPATPIVEPLRRVAGTADGLVASPARHAAPDEIAAIATARPWSSEPPRPELLPTVRPSPAVLLARWLPELDSPANSASLKTQFVQQLLPLVMQVNEGILARRARIAGLAPRIEAGETLSESDTRFVGEVLQEVRLDAWDADEVLRRLDAVPLSMALAQAAQESGWGRSRPAREDNALFGQTMFLAAGSRVQPFGALLETVEAYARNLNSHRAYAEFRRSRAALRARGDALDGHALVRFIERYSERGLGYVETIRQLMRSNNLFALDVRVLDAALDERALDLPLESAAPALDDLAVDRLLARPAAADAPAQGIDN